MDVVVIGAGGDCGREIVTQLVRHGVIDRSERLQLVGREGGASARLLYGLASDLADAYAESVPEIDVALRPEDVAGDLIVVAAGATLPTGGALVSRDDLARANAPVFAAYARALRDHGHGSEIVIVVSNPVELGVAVFARCLERRRVLGIGAYSDTMRFRREIAADLGMRRQKVHGFVAGEHGFAAVPLWSTVRVFGLERDELRRRLARLRQGHTIRDFPERVRAAREQVGALMEQERIAEAFLLVDAMPPDLRVVLKPYVTHYSGAKTVVATAQSTVELLQTLLTGGEAVVAAQVMVDGEFCGIRAPIGVPVVFGTQGFTDIIPLQLWEDEAELLCAGADAVVRKVAEWMPSDL